MKVCLIGASLDTGNLGVSALAESSIKVVLNHWPDAEIFLLGSGQKPKQHRLFLFEREIFVRALPMRISVNIFLPYHLLWFVFYGLIAKVFPRSSLKDRLITRNQYYQTLSRMDFAVDITGGDSFSDIYGFRRFILSFLPKWLVVFLGKELILLPQTYGPFKRRLTEMMAKYILNRASLIYSRDRAGIKYVTDMLGNRTGDGKIRFSPDVAFVLDSRRPSNMDIGSLPDVRSNKSVVVGLNVSGLLYYGGYTRNNMFGLRGDYRQIIHRIIEFLLAKEDVLVLLVPHVIPTVGPLDVEAVENDVAACLNMYKEFSDRHRNRIFMASGNYDQSQIKYVIGLCDFFLGSRMHSCIAALSQNIPAVGLAYSRKFSGVFDSVGVAELVIDLRNETEGNILALVGKAFSRRQAIVQKLSETIPEAQQVILEALSSVGPLKSNM